MDKYISLKDYHTSLLFGIANKNLKTFEEMLNAKIFVRGDKLLFRGDKKTMKIFIKALNILEKELKNRDFLDEKDIILALKEVENKRESIETVQITTPKKVITPRSPNQISYIKALKEKDIVFAIGPAGTGKTFLAVAVAVEFLLNNRVERIILTRPVVEAGESLGFLPGDFREKVEPYLTPLYDALFQMLPFDRIKRLIDSGLIEIAPLAYMRGRTLSNAYMILDEAQNTTPLQMKMFLTRIGLSTRVAITGDITQIDLPRDVSSGMKIAIEILHSTKEIEFCQFEKEDIVRHSLVKKIISAYEKYEKREKNKSSSSTEKSK